jgi:hypothetical protein
MHRPQIELEPDFAWLLSARNDVQHALLDLYEFLKKHRNVILRGEETHRMAFVLLVGATVSLWRAAFLSDIARGWPQILDRAELLLHDLLLTNSVSFSAERSVRDWMFGYYLKNSIYRLSEVQALLTPIESQALEKFTQFQEHALVGDRFDATESWDITLSTLRELTSHLEHLLTKPSSSSSASV